MKIIDRTELQAILADGLPVQLLEALPPKYFNEGHLPGARQLDYATAAHQAQRMRLKKDQRLVVYCANAECQNSHKGAEVLAAAGYTDVAVYAGGKQDWVDAGLVLDKAAARIEV
jgi:rhodanese-related sulfurtransferase